MVNMSRNAYFIDMENLLNGEAGDDRVLWEALDAIERAYRPGSRLTVALSHFFCGRVGHAVRARFPGARLVMGSGPDGADRALLAAMADTVLEPGDHVVVMSGDAIFAERVALLRSQGVSCTVIAQRNTLGARLRDAACACCFTDELLPTAMEVAA